MMKIDKIIEEKAYILFPIILSLLFIFILMIYFKLEINSKDDLIEYYKAKRIDDKGVVYQSMQNDCGAASLKMIFDLFNIRVNLKRIRKEIVKKKGTSVMSIKKIAERYGLGVKCFVVDKKRVDKIELPAIILIFNNQFVVL